MRQNITIGNSNSGVPKIGNNIDFDARLYSISGLTIENNVIIGATAVVVGVPAIILKHISNIILHIRTLEKKGL